MLAPNGTLEPIIAKACDGLRTALEIAGVKERLATCGSFVRPTSPAELTAFISD